MNLLKKILLNLLLMFLLSINSYAQEQTSFIKLENTFDGDSKVSQGYLGYLWITTNSGVYKFDGYDYKFKPYKSIFKTTNDFDAVFSIKKDTKSNMWLFSNNGLLAKIDSTSKKTSYTNSINKKNKTTITAVVSSKKAVWFGTKKGKILKYEHATQKIDSVTTLTLKNGKNVSISDLKFMNANDLWIGDKNGGIYKYSISSNELNSLNLPSNFINQTIKLAIDDHKNLWIAAEYKGLYKYNTKTNKFLRYHKTTSKDKHNMFISIFYDDDGFIWAGTDGDGLYRVNTQTDKIDIFKSNSNNKFSISNNTITSINKDNKGNIIIVAKKGVINILAKKNNYIKYYNGLEKQSPATILSVFKASDESLWLGTDGKGLNRVFKNNEKIHYSINSKGKKHFEGSYVQSVIEGRKGQIWIGTYQNGLWVFENNKFTRIDTPNDKGENILEIPFLFKDSKNRIWVTTSNSINVYNENKKLLKIYDYNSDGLKGTISFGICEDIYKQIWVVLNEGGLFKFNELNNNLEDSYFIHTPLSFKEFNQNKYKIRSLNSDKSGNLWLVFNSKTLVKYNVKSSKVASFGDRDKLKGISITAIIPEKENTLWISSSNGIHNYNYNKDEIKSYYKTDGLQSNNFVLRSKFKDNNGVLYFGGIYGANAFLPKNMSKQQSNAKLYIREIEILNRPADQIIGEQVVNCVENLKKLKLDSKQSSFSFKFSAIDNLMNTNYYYTYKLEGFDKNWINSKKSRVATYTNIPSGNYTFKVKVGIKKDAWNIDVKQLEIKIKPFWWNSNISYIAYFLIFIAILYSVFIWLKLRNKLIKETLENNQEKEIYAVKMNFFAKMSHEIQTPLTLILGPIEDMFQRADSNGNNLLKQRLQMISNNAKRLSRIATELMTVRNKELGKLRIYASENDIIGHLKKIAVSFSEQARFKKIDLIQNYPNENISVWYDLDKIEHVFYNLLSNAFKFTPVEGVVQINVKKNTNKDTIEIAISDSGPGIPEEELNNIFKLFYQSNLGKSKKGTGIGLALTKELINIHRGDVKVKSSSDNGTCFSITLSTKDNIFSNDEKVYIEKPNVLAKNFDKEFEKLKQELILKTPNNKAKKYTLLIVEDNVEMQIFLKDILAETYNLLIAVNGEQGLELAKKKNPDLILSDIMMPKMSGLEMSKLLQKKKSTAHIPIILLTAKNSTNTKIKSLEAGAIEYLNKPFNIHELILKVNNVLKAKEKVLLKYKTDLISAPLDLAEDSKDVVFITQLVTELNEQIENPEFKLEDLTKNLNMSYSVIYRKYQDISGKTLIEFFRSLRIKKAALLIVKNGYNISEAAFMVGYKDSKYFSKCFKEEFGVPPATFKREAKSMGIDKLLEKYKI